MRLFKLRLGLLFVLSLSFTLMPICVVQSQTFRPPAVPLVACDPYFSVWSAADRLTDVNTTHWTGKPQSLISLVRIDRHSFRVMGAEPEGVPALQQSSLQVLPTRTIYTFEGAGIRLILTFMNGDLPANLDLLSRPVTYLTWKANSIDGKKHNVSVYFDASSEMAVNTPDQPVNFQRADTAGIKAWNVGSVGQPVLQKKGDDIRIDWGYFYVAAPESKTADLTANTAESARNSFINHGILPSPADKASLQNNARNDSVIAFEANLGAVGSKPKSSWLMLAYDEIYSIQYMKHNLRPYWRRNGWQAADLLQAAARDYPSLQKRCAAFDVELMRDLRRVGGENYAELAALAYRQCFAAGKFVADDNGQPLFFCKENHSNGCISTADVFYPMSPQFLLFGPTLAKSFLVPFMNYAASPRWKFPFAPHDLGTYPQANGQVYGGGERSAKDQMPVEESGNLLLLFCAVAEMEGNADFAGLYWPQLKQWAEYLKSKGFDPENQLCTDDFAGHMAHNVNLSAKTICALGAFAKLCEMRGQSAEAADYSKVAHQFARRWIADADDGDHFRLAFDKPGTWSQKYNLVWDKILRLNLFPDSVAQKEMAYYKRMQNQYGLPLDCRKNYTKLDWTTWTATLTENRRDFEDLVNHVVAFLNATPDRTPMSDWYQTKTARRVGFDARPVVGGVFLEMLYHRPIWRKYADRDQTKAANWAPIPPPEKMTVILPAADTQPAIWDYTLARPEGDWTSVNYDDSSWTRGKSGFGTSGTPGAVIGTTWQTDDIWLRREVIIAPSRYDDLEGWLHHDEGAEVYINGVLALKTSGFICNYDSFPLTAAGKAALKSGKNVIAVHCHQTVGGQYIDFGLVDVQTN
ncbi:MAG: glutaminase domain-containing protein [Limisphaerales bacterium]